jgi:hypothetical protein
LTWVFAGAQQAACATTAVVGVVEASLDINDDQCRVGHSDI